MYGRREFVVWVPPGIRGFYVGEFMMVLVVRGSVLVSLVVLLCFGCGKSKQNTSHARSGQQEVQEKQGEQVDIIEFQERLVATILNPEGTSQEVGETQSEVLEQKEAAQSQKEEDQSVAEQNSASQSEGDLTQQSQVSENHQDTSSLKVLPSKEKEDVLVEASEVEESVEKSEVSKKEQSLKVGLCENQILTKATLTLPQKLLVGFVKKQDSQGAQYLLEHSWSRLDVKTQEVSLSFAHELRKDITSYIPTSESSEVSLDLILGKSVAEIEYAQLSWVYMALLKAFNPLDFSEGELAELLLSTLTKGAVLKLNDHTLHFAKVLAENPAAVEVVFSDSQVLRKEEQIRVFSEMSLKIALKETAVVLPASHSSCSLEEVDGSKEEGEVSTEANAVSE